MLMKKSSFSGIKSRQSTFNSDVRDLESPFLEIENIQTFDNLELNLNSFIKCLEPPITTNNIKCKNCYDWELYAR